MIILDASKMDSRKDAHLYLMEQLSFPDYYGKNLDALYDCLTDLDETTVVFVDLHRAEGSYCDKVVRVFREAAEDNPRLHILNEFPDED